MTKVLKEHYYEENDIVEKIKNLKLKLNEYDITHPQALEISRELDELIVLYMQNQKQAKHQ